MATDCGINIRITAPTLPPRALDLYRPFSWRCWLLGCLFNWQRVDAWWIEERCRWCHRQGEVELRPETSCSRCGRAMPASAPDRCGPPPPPDPRSDPGGVFR